MAFAPRHPREPRLDVLGLECRLDGRVLGVGERVVVGPGRLLQIKGTAMADAAAISVRKPAAVEKLRGETGRIEAAERCLRMRRIREAERTNPAVAPGLPHQPAEGVVSVLGLAQIFCEAALRPARRRLVIRGALEEDRTRTVAGRPVDVRRQPDAVPRRHPDVALDYELLGSRRIHPISSSKSASAAIKSCVNYYQPLHLQQIYRKISPLSCNARLVRRSAGSPGRTSLRTAGVGAEQTRFG